MRSATAESICSYVYCSLCIITTFEYFAYIRITYVAVNTSNTQLQCVVLILQVCFRRHGTVVCGRLRHDLPSSCLWGERSSSIRSSRSTIPSRSRISLQYVWHSISGIHYCSVDRFSRVTCIVYYIVDQVKMCYVKYLELPKEVPKTIAINRQKKHFVLIYIYRDVRDVFTIHK